jgi:hypothetical protein
MNLKILFIVILILFIVYLCKSNKEGFIWGGWKRDRYMYDPRLYYMPIYSKYFYDHIYFDPYLRSSRNESYDIRGDPIIIPRKWYAWNNGVLNPIYPNGMDV